MKRCPSICETGDHHYLRLNLGLQGFQVFNDLVTGWCSKNDDASVVLPTAVRDFVERFDAGAYAELAIPSQRKRRVGMKAPRKKHGSEDPGPGQRELRSTANGGAC